MVLLWTAPEKREFLFYFSTSRPGAQQRNGENRLERAAGAALRLLLGADYDKMIQIPAQERAFGGR